MKYYKQNGLTITEVESIEYQMAYQKQQLIFGNAFFLTDEKTFVILVSPAQLTIK